MLRYFVEKVCTGYSRLTRTNDTTYRICLKALLPDAQSIGECVGGYCVGVGEDEYSLRFDENASDEERGSSLSSQNDRDNAII